MAPGQQEQPQGSVVQRINPLQSKSNADLDRADFVVVHPFDEEYTPDVAAQAKRQVEALTRTDGPVPAGSSLLDAEPDLAGDGHDIAGRIYLGHPRPAKALTFQYRNSQLDVLHVTSVPTSTDEAIDYFSLVTQWFPKDPSEYLYVEEWVPSEDDGHFVWRMLPLKYNVKEDEVEDL